jgi:protein-S-isoprenylcysteine O-methyltransferase Ste14
LAILSLVLFGIAGRVDWPAAWLIIVLFAVHIVLGGWLLFRHDPDLLTERLTTASNVPRWDLLIKRGNRILELMLLATVALDAGRFGWSVVPVAVRAMGTAAVFAAVGVMYRCAAANHFLSRRSRIQTERGHTVVQHGPYRLVRHPLYASRLVLAIGLPLTLGSWFALVPAALLVFLVLLRTFLEDRMLTTHLTGYREYAERVPARLVPGLW